ncbi:tyrosine-type recombinase/integrase [Marinobacter halophilus]|uniref:Integrase n=1 Tax=Marinobacter halophilus TaxID=1323740 RepID=A0A2T1KER1_9GAMM|nr:integrase arm-type DNA-binding domain-containing protein [Marinobacter halophilus]PSF08607.1 integrase [Marinobacter halophilus]GGC62070.1 integrase [Marinobacter halophilus]
MSRAANKLTDTAVRNANTEGKPQRKLADGGGLTLVVKPDSKVWWFRYRYSGKERTLTIGNYPAVSLKQARAQRDESKRMLSEGIDPVTHRATNKAERIEASANNFKAVALEWLEHVHKKSVGNTTWNRNERRLEMYAYPKLGRHPMAEIEPTDVLLVLREIDRAGHLESAHRVKTLIGQVFRYAVSTGRASRDVTADLRGLLPPAKPKHHAAVVTPNEIAELLKTLDGYWGTPTVRKALTMAPYVFLRPGNLRQMRWDEIDWDAASWTTETTKNGESLVVPLARQVVELLRELQEVNGKSEWVFPNGHSRGRPMSENAITGALKRMELKDIMTGHGFRAMAKTVLTERLDFRTEIIEMQMAHRVADTHGRAYNRTTWLPERREMMQQWANYLDSLKKLDNNVTPIRQVAD